MRNGAEGSSFGIIIWINLSTGKNIKIVIKRWCLENRLIKPRSTRTEGWTWMAWETPFCSESFPISLTPGHTVLFVHHERYRDGQGGDHPGDPVLRNKTGHDVDRQDATDDTTGEKYRTRPGEDEGGRYSVSADNTPGLTRSPPSLTPCATPQGTAKTRERGTPVRHKDRGRRGL